MKGFKDQLYALVGKQITIDYTVTEGIMGRGKNSHKWFVTEAYPHHVKAKRTCENGYEITECFNIGTLVARGILQNRNR